VSVEGREVARGGRGLLVLLGVGAGDGPGDVDYLVDKLLNLRVFDDEEGRLNLSLCEVGGEVTVVPQFTLYGDARKGRRPSYTGAAPPQKGLELYNLFLQRLRERGLEPGEGVFGAHMHVELLNDGPVTLLLESPGGSGD
jgi:D-tyrosyl-tRNA(Tyr) deacylase